MLQPTDVTAVLRNFIAGEGEHYDQYGDTTCGGVKEVHVWIDHNTTRTLWKIDLEYVPSFSITKVRTARRVDGDADHNRTIDDEWDTAYGMNPWDLLTETERLAIRERVFSEHTEAL